MNKKEFFSRLRAGLAGLPQEDIEKSIDYYSEMIEDRIEEGLSEEKAVEALGCVDDIVSQILMDTSLPKLVKAKVKPQGTLRVWEIVLLVLGSPVWLSLLFAAACIVLSLYMVLWAGITVLYAVSVSFAAGAVSGLFGTIWFVGTGNFIQGILFFGAGLACLGITVLFFLGSNQIAKRAAILSKQILIGIKTCFVKKEETE